TRRRKLHQSIAEWHENRDAGNLTPYYSLLAQHWRQAEVRPKAIDYAVKAGRQAIDSFANPEDVHFFRDALMLDQDDPDRVRGRSSSVSPAERARWRIWLGKALFNIGKTSDARIQIERGLSGLGQPVPIPFLRAAGLLLAQTARQALHRLGANCCIR